MEQTALFFVMGRVTGDCDFEVKKLPTSQLPTSWAGLRSALTQTV